MSAHRSIRLLHTFTRDQLTRALGAAGHRDIAPSGGTEMPHRIGSMVADTDMLTVSEEAEVVGRHITMVSRRRANDPDHPANQPGSDAITLGKRVHTRAPRAAVVAYWAAVQKGAGRPRRTATPQPQETTDA